MKGFNRTMLIMTAFASMCRGTMNWLKGETKYDTGSYHQNLTNFLNKKKRKKR